MLNHLRRAAACSIAALAILLVPACEDAVSRESFDQIAIGMDKTEVESILGGPGEMQEATGVGIDAGGLLDAQGGPDDTQDYLWGDETTGIMVRFKDGKVVHKRPIGLD